MNVESASRPASSEFAEYYGPYIDRVPNSNITQLMFDQIAEFSSVLDTIFKDQASVTHDPSTWTIKQVVGHLIDVEKVFGYRGHRFACNDFRPILGMDQNAFVNNLTYDLAPLSDLAIELKYTRRSNMLFLKRLPAAAWDRQGTVDDDTISVRAIAYLSDLAPWGGRTRSLRVGISRCVESLNHRQTALPSPGSKKPH